MSAVRVGVKAKASKKFFFSFSHFQESSVRQDNKLRYRERLWNSFNALEFPMNIHSVRWEASPLKGLPQLRLHSGIHVTIYAQIKMFNFTTIARNRKLRQSQRLNKFIKDLFFLRQKKRKRFLFYANSFPPARHSKCNQHCGRGNTRRTLGADKQQKWKVRSRKNVFLTSLFGMKEKFNLFTVYLIKSICLQSAPFRAPQHVCAVHETSSLLLHWQREDLLHIARFFSLPFAF